MQKKLFFLLNFLVFQLLISEAQNPASLINSNKYLQQNLAPQTKMDYYIKAMDLQPYDYEGFLKSGMSSMNFGNYEEAILYFQKSASIYQKLAGQGIDSARNDNPYPAFYIGYCYKNLYKLDSAIYYYEKAHQIDKDFIDVYNELALLYIAKNEYETAMLYLVNANKKDKNRAEVVYNIGYINYLQGSIKDAIKYAEKSIEIDPKYEIAYNLLAYINYLDKKPQKALHYYNTAIENNPNAISSLYARASVYLELNQTDLAYTDYQKVYEFDSTNYMSLGALGNIDVTKFRFKEGIAKLQKSLLIRDNLLRSNLMFDYNVNEFESYIKDYSEDKLSLSEKEIIEKFLKSYYSFNLVDFQPSIENFLKQNPTSILGKRLYTYYWFNQGALEEHFELINELLELDSSLIYINLLKGEYYYLQAKYDSSKIFFERSIRQYPEYSFAHYYNILANINLGQTSHALDEIEKTLEISPDFAQLYNLRGNIYLSWQLYQSAINNYFKAAYYEPNNAYIINQIALTYRSASKPDSALYFFTRAINIEPENPDYYLNRAITYVQENENDKALADYSKSIELYPKHPMVWYYRAGFYMNTNQFKKAEEDYNKSLKLNSKYPYSYINRGKSLSYQGKYDKAIADYSQAIKLDSSIAVAYKLIGDCKLYDLKYEDAQPYYIKSILLDSTNQYAYYQLGTCYSFLEKYNKAILNFKKATDIDDEYAWAYYREGHCFSYLENYDSAIYYFNIAITIDSTFSSAYGNLGWVYYLKEDFDKCIQFSEKSVEYDPTAYYAMYNIALSKLRLGLFNEADKLYKKYISQQKETSGNVNEGAIEDLQDLIKKNIMVEESKRILRTRFKIKI